MKVFLMIRCCLRESIERIELSKLDALLHIIIIITSEVFDHLFSLQSEGVVLEIFSALPIITKPMKIRRRRKTIKSERMQ